MNMKRTLLSTTLCLALTGAWAQATTDIKLNAPDKSRGTSVMQALAQRHSTRESDTRMLADTDLADLLWAANGVSRADGKHTAPSALNRQDIDIYVISAKGAYLYRADTHTLSLVAEGDHRKLVAAGQTFVEAFPVSLVLVSDLSRLGEDNERTRLMAAVDAGCVSENISLFCAATGLATVPRATMSQEGLAKVLKLKPAQLPLINHPVGYFK